MLKSYFKIAFRTLFQNKTYAFINVSGLALGLAASIVIFLIVQNELSYDRYHKKADRTYRITVHGLDFNPSVSFAVAPRFRTDFPEVENVSQYLYQEKGLVQVGHDRYNEEGFAFADDQFAQIFDFNWLRGNSKLALKEPNSVVLTETMAKKYFGTIDALGKSIKLNNAHELAVTGVIKDLPSNTHLIFTFLVSWETIRKRELTNTEFWDIGGGNLYVTLPDQVSEKNVAYRLNAFIQKNWGEEIAKGCYLILQPITEIHFEQHYLNQVSMPRSRESVYGLAWVGLFIVLTACINFVNLAITQSLKRAKEVGIRKALGAYRKQLVTQVLTETTLLVWFSIALALTFVCGFLPHTKSLLNIRIEPSHLFNPEVLIVITCIAVVTILIAGLYPALVQSGFKPIKALKSGSTDYSGGNSRFGKGLVVIQFAITQLLIVATIIIGKQIDFFVNQDIGFDKEAIVTFPTGNKSDVMYKRLSDISGVVGISLASGSPAGVANAGPFSSPESGMHEIDVTEIKSVDEKYMPLFKLTLLAGEPITKTNPKDTIYQIVANQTLVERIGIQEPLKAIGKKILIGNTAFFIKGVVKDFQSESKHKKIRSCFMIYDPQRFWNTSVKVNSRTIKTTLSSIGKVWTELNPESLFSYEFVDQRIAQMYMQEEKMFNAVTIFSGIAILIGCLGLYGLVSMMAVQRTKEIGIRKVLGATIWGIVLLFFNRFIWLILAAFVISAPLAWFAMNKWLEEFAYHITIGPAIFLVSILVMVMLAAMTISYQSIKAALVNPVDSLKTE
jgi:putative ABC transport system permease protein